MSAPNSISGLYCWLDANYAPNITIDPRSRAVSSWTDRQSGLVFSGGFPQFAHYGQYSPGVQFRGGTYLQNSGFTQNLGAAHCVMVVVSRVYGGNIFYKGNSYNTSWPYGSKKWWFGDSSGTNEPGAVGLYPCMVGNSQAYTSSNQQVTGDLDVVVYNLTSSTNMDIYMNAVLTTGYSYKGLSTVTDPGNYAIIGGAGPNNACGFFTGTLHELCVWNRALSLAEIQNVYSYFYSKWGNSFSTLPISGSISMSQMRNEIGGDSGGSVSMSELLTNGTYGSVMQSNPNRITTGSTNFSKFYKTGKRVVQPGANFFYRARNNNSSNPWGPGNMSAGSQLIWLTQYESSIYPIVNYYINFYNISQNSTGAAQAGTWYLFQDDNANYYLNGTNFANPTYTGGTNSYSQTAPIGKSLLQGYIINTGGPGDFQGSWYLNNGTYQSYTGAGLVTRIPFENSVTDVVGGRYITQGNGNLTYTAGVLGQCAYFNGNTSQTTPAQWFWFASPINNPPFSVSFWFNPQSTPWYGTLIGLGDGKGTTAMNWDYGTSFNGNNSIGAFIDLPGQWNISNLNTGAMTLGTWYHICLTVSSNFVATMYLNGAQASQQTGLGPFNLNTNVFYIGGNADGGGLTPNRGFNGYMDELCIHYGDLTTNQITTMYNQSPYYNATNSVWYTDAECEWNYYSWAYGCTYYHQGGYNAALEGSNPDYQWHLGNQTGSTLNHIYWNQRIQDYSNFTLYFEIYVGSSSGADGLFMYVGQTNVTGGFIVYETGSNGGYIVDFQIYTGGGNPQSIILWNGSTTKVASYNTSGFIASAWQPVYVYYNKSTTNTWSCTWNGTSVWTYSDPNQASWIGTSGCQWGFGFRDGGVAGTAYIRHVQLFHR